MILFAIGHPPKGLRRGAPSACLPQAGFNIVPRHFSGPSELRLNYSCVSAERKAGSSDRHGSQNEMGTRTPASPPQTNGETTSRPLLNHAVNLSRLSTRSRAERQLVALEGLPRASRLSGRGCCLRAPKRHWARQHKQKSSHEWGEHSIFDFDLRWTQTAENVESPLFSRGLRRSTEMRVTQIPQHRLFVVAHPLREVWVIQPLVARRFRHILKHAQLLLHHLLAVPRHLLPLRQHVVFDVLALLRRQLPPVVFFDLLVRPLLWRHAVPLIELLPDLVLLVRRKALEGFTVL